MINKIDIARAEIHLLVEEGIHLVKEKVKFITEVAMIGT
jgi:hypothetical protein